MSRYGDVILSHQWENALNYLYYEALESGYPLVHSSPMIDAGYYYPSFDIDAGAEQLKQVMLHHDESITKGSIDSRAEAALSKHLIDRHQNIEQHSSALESLFAERQAT
jgi:hypothetical protein